MPYAEPVSIGRPTKLDDLTSKRILDAIAEGGSRHRARPQFDVARLAREGTSGSGTVSGLRRPFKSAEADAELAMVRVVRGAAEMSWQAAAWWLERRRPKAYALRKERFFWNGSVR